MKVLILLSVFLSINAISAGGSANSAEGVHSEIQMLNPGSGSISANQKANSTSQKANSASQKTNSASLQANNTNQAVHHISHDSRDFHLFGYKPLKVEPQLSPQTLCESLVCESIKQAETVPVIGDVPKREGNKTIEALTSAIYIAGEVGLADNHAEVNLENYVLD